MNTSTDHLSPRPNSDRRLQFDNHQKRLTDCPTIVLIASLRLSLKIPFIHIYARAVGEEDLPNSYDGQRAKTRTTRSPPSVPLYLYNYWPKFTPFLFSVVKFGFGAVCRQARRDGQTSSILEAPDELVIISISQYSWLIPRSSDFFSSHLPTSCLILEEDDGVGEEEEVLKRYNSASVSASKRVGHRLFSGPLPRNRVAHRLYTFFLPLHLLDTRWSFLHK